MNIYKRLFAGVLAMSGTLIMSHGQIGISHLGHDYSVVAAGHVDSVLIKDADLKKTWKGLFNSFASSTQIATSLKVGYSASYALTRLDVKGGRASLEVSYEAPATSSLIEYQTDFTNLQQIVDVTIEGSPDFQGVYCIALSIDHVIAEAVFKDGGPVDMDVADQVAKSEDLCLVVNQ